MPRNRFNPLAPLKKYSKQENGCWEWTGSVGHNGYGKTTYNSEHKLAHRLMYELLVGEIPEGHQIDHLCKNRICVNPEHLEAVTHAENVRRSSVAKLTESKAEQIRELYATGDYNQYKLAEMFNIGQWQISRIVTNKRWRKI